MKKAMNLILILTSVIIFTGCEDELTPEPVTNGLIVTIGDVEFDARSMAECSYSYQTRLVEFYATTRKNELFTVKFVWDEYMEDSRIYISDHPSNMISFDSSNAGLYYIDHTAEMASSTYIEIIRMVPGTVIEAKFRGFIYRGGSASDEVRMEDGYFTTSNFTE